VRALAGECAADRQAQVVMAALGSSFAAGPGLGDYVHSGTCVSGNNYAHLLARSLTTIGIAVELTDLSVCGATTEGVLADQIPVIPAAATLVTVTVGGNDLGFIAAVTCTAANKHEPNSNLATGARCSIPAKSDAEIKTVSDSLASIASGITTQAPDARVVFVDYLTVLHGPLNDETRLYFDQSAYDGLVKLQDAIVKANKDGAEAAEAELVSISSKSLNHAVGSKTPWIEGLKTGAEASTSFHPNAAGMQAIADELRTTKAVRAALRMAWTGASRIRRRSPV
jgi:lysophospholipase L1-like esterase